MSAELTVLVLSVLWGIFQILLAIALITRQRGTEWNMGPRDEAMKPPTGIAGRVDRALQNFKETFPFFVAAVLVTTSTHTSNMLTQSGAWIYLIARMIYLPLYAGGVPFVRTIVWTLSMMGLAMVALGPWMT